MKMDRNCNNRHIFLLDSIIVYFNWFVEHIVKDIVKGEYWRGTVVIFYRQNSRLVSCAGIEIFASVFYQTCKHTSCSFQQNWRSQHQLYNERRLETNIKQSVCTSQLKTYFQNILMNANRFVQRALEITSFCCYYINFMRECKKPMVSWPFPYVSFPYRIWLWWYLLHIDKSYHQNSKICDIVVIKQCARCPKVELDCNYILINFFISKAEQLQGDLWLR